MTKNSEINENAIEVFFSYTPKDEALRDQLAEHLSLLKQQKVITAWHDRQIGAGTERMQAIETALSRADIILLLVSSAFLASEHHWGMEMEQAMARHDAGEACVIPVILRPVDWQHAPFGKLQACPKGAKAITTWSNADEAFTDVAQSIRQAVERLLKNRQQREVEMVAAKANYLKQLVTRFDDVQFLGVALDRHEETSKQLAQIFVMPDVEEAGRRGRDDLMMGWREDETIDSRQSQLLQEQRLRSQLERSGRKFSARQLLQQHQKKIVLLGAPGSGKTTLMSFFAVELAERQAIAKTSDASTEGLSPNAMALSPNAMALSGETIALRPNTMALSADTKGLLPNTMALSGNTMALSGDTKGLRGDTKGLRGDTKGLRGDTDAFAATQPLPLPILIRIRDWALHPDQTIPEYARQFAEKTMHVKPLPKGFFEHWLDNGQALILLDGLDEVAESSKRHHLVQCIENFLVQYPHNRAIITSRPAGYRRDFFRTEEFPHYELQPFDDGKIEEFCDRWYRSRVQDTAEALRRRESLQKALNQQDRIKLLARNPLLLTIIALIHRYQARLPRERYKLYDKAVETLLTAWDDNKELSNQTVLKYLQLDDLRRLMEHLAYWIHTQGNTGDTEGGTLIDKDELIHQLTQEIKTLKQLQLYEAKEEAKRFVEFIRDRTGLLNEQGQDCYAFVHKTFQEYLTAQEINYQADNEDDFEIVLTHIEQHLHAPHWREVLLLLIAQQKPKKAALAIHKVLTANSPYEQWLHRDVLFAGRCLAEDPKGLRGADINLPLEILGGLVEMETREVNQIGYKAREQVLQIICSFYETDFEVQLLQLLEKKSESVGKYRLWQYRVALGQEDVVKNQLLTHFNSEHFGAAYEMSVLGNTSDRVMDKLLKTLSIVASEHPDLDAVRPNRFSNSDQKADVFDDPSDPRAEDEWSERSLLKWLSSKNSNFRFRTATRLGHLGKTLDWVEPAIVQWIEQHQEEECVGAGIDALWEIVEGKG